jgi:membrane protein insertase Oxa1/YidC/SpoIIIJ
MSFSLKISIGLGFLVALIAYLELSLARFLWWDVQLGGKDLMILLLLVLIVSLLDYAKLAASPSMKRGKLSSDEWKPILFRSIVISPLIVTICSWALISIGNSM